MKQKLYRGCYGKCAKPHIGKFMACDDCAMSFESEECEMLRTYLRYVIIHTF